MNAESTPLQWPGSGTSRIPFGVYTDEALYRRELERFFYRGHWNYVGLEAEVPGAGDFKRTVVGERSVIMVRDMDGAINVVENVCAHRGVAFCRERHGNRAGGFVCPYHQWNYTLAGDLRGVPFRRGVRQRRRVNGGMPADFDPAAARPDASWRWRAAAASCSRRSTTTSSRSTPFSGPAILRLVRPPVRRPRAEDPRLQPAAHPGQLEADAGEHQGPVPPGPAAHLVRDLRPLARRQRVAPADGRSAPPRRDDLDARQRGRRRAR